MKTESLTVEVGDFPKQQGTASTPRRCRMLSDMPHLKKASYRCIRLQDVDSPPTHFQKREVVQGKVLRRGDGSKLFVCCFVFLVHFLGGLWEGSLSLKHANVFGTSPNNLSEAFSSLQQTNGDLIAEYNKRANNHQQLLALGCPGFF